MKIRCLSDLHLEFLKSDEIEDFIKQIPVGDEDEVCVLAGDVGNPYLQSYDVFMNFIRQSFKKTFVITGNHEYYNKWGIRKTNAYLDEYFRKFDNITFLNNTCEHYENHWFVGTTLWCKITYPEFEINDVNIIPDFDHHTCNELNKLNVAFLTDALKTYDDCIIITHHLPSESLIDPKYRTKRMEPYNQWFFTNLDDLIKLYSSYENKINCWIYGHTHTPSYCKKYGIPFLCNPIGYPRENKKPNFGRNITFDSDFRKV
jgi:predicted phosphohydrolase